MATDFRGLLRLLIEGEIPFVLVGGYCAILHGSTQLTRDLDVVCPLDHDGCERLLSVIAPYNPTHRMVPDVRPFCPADFTDRPVSNLYLKTDLGILDCLYTIQGLGDYRACLKQSEKVEIGDLRFRSLTRSALITAKRSLARPKDLQTVAELEVFGSEIDEES